MLLLVLVSAPGGAASPEEQGDVLRWALPLAALTATAWDRDAAGAVQYGKAFGATAVAVVALKAVVEKERPDGSDEDAFPSGHAAMAFSGAAYLHRRYGPRAGVPAFAAATWVALTRLEADQHDSLDVAAGAALGLLGVWYFARDDAPAALAVAPTLIRQAPGLSVRWRF